MTTNFNSGICNTNPLDSQCYCFMGGPSRYYKIFDTATSSYVCCGTINLNYTSTNQNPLSTNDATKNSIYNAALLDDPRCLGWWNGSIGNFDGLVIGIKDPPTIPVAGQDWYLPDSNENGLNNMPVSYGPSDNDIAVLVEQQLINSIITIPTTTLNSPGTTATCISGTQPYWMRFINPNNRQLEYVESLVCANVDTVKSSEAFNSANFALFSVICQSGTPSTECSVTVGEVTNVAKSTLGSLVINSKQYGGGTPTNPQTSSTPWYQQPWFYILMVVLVIIIIIVIVLVVYQEGKKRAGVRDQDFPKTK